MGWALPCAAWGFILGALLTAWRMRATRRLTWRRRDADRLRLEALVDAVRESRPTLAEITAAPGQVTWPCGCTPCAPHAAEIAAREKARAVIAARDAWAAEWNERLHRP